MSLMCHVNAHVDWGSEVTYSSGVCVSTVTQPFRPYNPSVTTGAHTVDCSSLHVILHTMESSHALVCSMQEGALNLFDKKIQIQGQLNKPFIVKHGCALNSKMTFSCCVWMWWHWCLKPPTQTKGCIFPPSVQSRVVYECVRAYAYMVFACPRLTGSLSSSIICRHLTTAEYTASHFPWCRCS